MAGTASMPRPLCPPGWMCSAVSQRLSYCRLLVSVCSGARSNVQDDDGVVGTVNLVEHPPVASEPSTIDTRKFLAERLAHTSRLIQQRPGNELGGSGGHIMWQAM